MISTLISKSKLRLGIDALPKGKTGLGDAIEIGARFFGVRPCAGCKKRKDILNKRFTLWHK